MGEDEIERGFVALQEVVGKLDYPTRRAIQASLNRLAQSAYLRSVPAAAAPPPGGGVPAKTTTTTGAPLGAQPSQPQLQQYATAVAVPVDPKTEQQQPASKAPGSSAPAPSEDILDRQVARILFNKFLPPSAQG